MAVDTDELLRQRIQEGHLVEMPEEMTPGYRQELIHIVTVSADTELLSAPAYYRGARQAPTINSMISGLAIIQDELGHAHIAYRVLEDLGVSKEELVYGRRPQDFRYPYAFDVPLDSWVELFVANAFYDRAGICLLSDIYQNTSYGPWKRALVKVNREETFHLRHGEMWMRRYCDDGPERRAEVQRAVDWMFPMTVEWFGLPDELKTHADQLGYRMKGLSNDQLRQKWMGAVVPLCQEVGLHVPAHRHPESGEYDLEYPFPCAFDEQEKRWDLSQPIGWQDVVTRWKRRGPRNEEMVHEIRRSHAELAWMFDGQAPGAST